MGADLQRFSEVAYQKLVMPFTKGHTIRVGMKHPPEAIEKFRNRHIPHRPETVAKIVAANKKNGMLDYFKSHSFKGTNHAHWKGEKVSYVALHQWLYRELGQPDTCEFCDKSGLSGKSIHWANKSGFYKRELSDWLRLCAKCHYHYDRD